MDNNSIDILLKLNDELTPALQRAQAAVREAAQSIAVSGQTGATGIKGLHSSFQQFDALLSTAGVNIGKEVKAVLELGDAGGKSASQIGLLGTAGLVTGAALAGWKLGRLISDALGLDTAIGNLTARVLGLGDAEAQVAGAQQDSINLAIARGAAETIKYTEAIRYNHDWVEKRTQKMMEAIKAGQEFRQAEIEIDTAGKGWQGTLQGLNGDTVSAIKYYLEAGVAQSALATYYHLTDVQIKAVVSSMEAEKQALKELKDYQEVWAKFHLDTLVLASEAEKKFTEELKQQLQQRNQSVVDGFTAIRTETQRLKDFEDQSWMDATDFQVKQVWRLADEKIRSFKGTEQQRAAFASVTLQAASAEADALYAKDVQYATKVMELLKETTRTAQQEAALTQAIINGEVSNEDYLRVLLERQNQGKTPTGLVAPSNGLRGTTNPFIDPSTLYVNPFIQSRDGGGYGRAGEQYLIGRGAQPEVFTPKTDGWFTPAGAGATNVYVTVEGSVTTERELGNRLSEQIKRQILSGVHLSA